MLGPPALSALQHSKKKAPEGLGTGHGASHSREPSSQRFTDSLTGGSTTSRAALLAVSVAEEPLEPIRCERRVPRGILNIAMPEIGLKRTGIDPIVRKLKSRRMAQHVGVRLDAELRKSFFDLRRLTAEGQPKLDKTPNRI